MYMFKDLVFIHDYKKYLLLFTFSYFYGCLKRKIK